MSDDSKKTDNKNSPPIVSSVEYGEFICHEYKYDFYTGERDFVFEKKSEDETSQNPYNNGNNNFIFPERECVPNDKLDDLINESEIISSIEYGSYTCKEYKYDFYVGRRDFVFEKKSEDETSQNPYKPFVVGRRDFVFPERECEPSENSNVDIYYGGSLEVDLTVPILLSIDFNYGTSINDDIELPTLFEIEFIRGSYIEDVGDSIILESDLYYGSEVELKSFSIPIDIDLYHGNYLEKTYITLPISSEFYYGSDIDIKLDLPFNIDFYYGGTLGSQLTIYDELNLNLYYGSSVEVIFDESLIVEFIRGHHIEPTLLNHSNESLEFSNVDYYYGNSMEMPFISEVHDVFLYPYVLGAYNKFVSVSFEGTYELFFDVGNHCCYDNFIAGSNDLYWEIGDSFNVNEIIGANVGFHVEKIELTTMVNMEADVYRGGYLYIEDTIDNVIENIFLSYGNTLEPKFDWDRRTNLCPPNIIINGDNVNIDMIDLYDYDCKYELLSYGTTLELDTISITNCFIGDIYYGTHMDFKIIFSPPMYIDIHHGRYVWFDLSTTPYLGESNNYYGSYIRATFYEPTIDLYYGTTLDDFNMVTEYHVEFIDDGCLDNEYIYTDEEGVRQDELFIPKAVEFLPYRHDIKARCF